MRVNSGSRVTALVSVVLLLTMGSSLGALLTTREMERRMQTMASRYLPGVEVATELQKELLQQRGLVATYMLDDGRLAWINDLDRIKPAFAHSLGEAKRTGRTDEEQKIVTQLADVYGTYDQERERAIALYRAGHRTEARSVLLGDVSRLADQAHELCRLLVAANERSMRAELRKAHARVDALALVLATSVGLATLLSLGVLLLVFRRLLLPVRRLARDARALSDTPAHLAATPFSDDLHELEYYSRVLMSDVTRTRSHLEDSQRRLLMAEKLAAVGKFAACAAHEIRSPLTSMKLWLYQLKQRVARDADGQHSCAVLEEEIGRLEELATSFLQFSRPPALQLVPVEMGDVLNGTLALARHRLEEKKLRLVHLNGTPIPRILADAHQLRQVLLNLITNAIDASPEGGTVRITESCEPGENGRSEVVLRIQDDGAGVPETVRARLFEPFVTSKPNGTGLGLAVASSIVAQHGGHLLLEPSHGSGAAFALRIAACNDLA